MKKNDVTTVNTNTTVNTTLEDAMSIQNAIDSEMKPQILRDLEITTKRPLSLSRHLYEAALKALTEITEEDLEAEKSRIQAFHKPSDATLAWVESVIDPEGTSMVEDVAMRLTTLFSSPDFNSTNFPEMPERHIRRLKWVAKNRGFKSLQEVLVVLARSSEIKGTAEEVAKKIEELAADPRPLRSDLAQLVVPVAQAIAKKIAKQKKQVKSLETRAHRGSLYTNRTVFLWDGGRMRFEQSFGAPSLLESIIETRNGPQDVPVSFQIVNVDTEGKPLPDDVIRRFNEAGIAIFKEKAGVPLIRDEVPMEERMFYMQNLTAAGDSDLDAGQINWAFVNKHDVWTPAAKWLFATFSKSIDSAYVPSLITSPIEPESFRKVSMAFTDCCDYQGRSLGMDGGGWLPPFYDGRPQVDQQIRGEIALDRNTIAYTKGMAFVKWDCALVRLGGKYEPLWLDFTQDFLCQAMGMTREQLRDYLWSKASDPSLKGYPEFTLYTSTNSKGETDEVVVKYVPVCDINQVKGNAKDRLKSEVKASIRDFDSRWLGKEGAAQIPVYPGYMGALRLEQGFSTMDLCFEALMWMDWDPNDQGEEGYYNCPTKQCINSNQLALAERLVDEGLDGLASRAALQDEGIQIMLKVLGAFNVIRKQQNKKTQEIQWWMIPTLRSRIWRSLERALYHGADGGGISCPQVVFQLSETIPEGHCIYTAARHGDEVVCYRFPMSTHTAMVVTKVLDPRDYPELWADPDGNVPINRMIMNPRDLTFRMQGDDDGDKGGASTDPLLVAMAKNTWESRLVDIEVQVKGAQAEKYNEPLWSVYRDIPMTEEGQVVYHPTEGETYPFYTSGLELAARSRRGQVGRTTRLQQRLHAMMWRVEDGQHTSYPIFGERAIAMAWPNQGEIDIEKKPVLRIDVPKVLAKGLFTQVVDGDVRPGSLTQAEDDQVWRMSPQLVNPTPGGYDVDFLSRVVTQDYLIRQGCFTYNPEKVINSDAPIPECYAKDAGEPCGWVQKDKRIDLTKTGWEGPRKWRDGELEIDSIMHWSFRNMEAIWDSMIKPAFQLPETDTEFDFGEVLAEVLRIQGENILDRPQSWYNDENYQTMRAKMGADEWKKARKLVRHLNAGENQEQAEQAIWQQAAVRQQQILLSASLQDFADMWRLENWRWKLLTEQADQHFGLGNDSEGKRLMKAAEGCLNSMVRLINFGESPVAMLLGVSGVDDCPFLTKERQDDLMAYSYRPKSRRETFDRLGEWIKKNGHLHTQVQDAHANRHHMVECPICMAKAKQLLVGRFRNDSRTRTVDYFRDLTSYTNQTGQYKA